MEWWSNGVMEGINKSMNIRQAVLIVAFIFWSAAEVFLTLNIGAPIVSKEIISIGTKLFFGWSIYYNLYYLVADKNSDGKAYYPIEE